MATPSSSIVIQVAPACPSSAKITYTSAAATRPENRIRLVWLWIAYAVSVYIAHGLVFSIWVTLVLTQALVVTGRTAVHHRLGRVAFVLAPCMVAIGLAALNSLGERRDRWHVLTGACGLARRQRGMLSLQALGADWVDRRAPLQ